MDGYAIECLTSKCKPYQTRRFLAYGRGGTLGGYHHPAMTIFDTYAEAQVHLWDGARITERPDKRFRIVLVRVTPACKAKAPRLHFRHADDQCPDCGGTGAEDQDGDRPIKCATCGGVGHVAKEAPKCESE